MFNCPVKVPVIAGKKGMDMVRKLDFPGVTEYYGGPEVLLV